MKGKRRSEHRRCCHESSQSASATCLLMAELGNKKTRRVRFLEVEIWFGEDTGERDTWRDPHQMIQQFTLGHSATPIIKPITGPFIILDFPLLLVKF